MPSRDDPPAYDIAGPAERPLALVVEDDELMGAMLVDLLAEAFTIARASNGAQGLLDALRLRPAVVVSDVVMPEMDGIEMTRRMRADARLSGIPVLLVSSKSELPDRVAGLEIADDYLVKPFGGQELVLRARKLAMRAVPPAEEEIRAEDAAFAARLRAVVDARMGDERLDIPGLARALAMSPRTLQREIQRVFRRSPVAWVREARLGHAHELLRRGACSTVGEAAAAVGMSRTYFTRAYLAWSGRSPSEDLRGK